MREFKVNGHRCCEETSVFECLFMIWAIGCDYDGEETVDGLKKLVDELVAIAQKAGGFLEEGLVVPAKGEKSLCNLPSPEDAAKMRDAIMQNLNDLIASKSEKS